jgi:anti-sigma regulatory factor (Ser/Thr protein kinase)
METRERRAVQAGIRLELPSRLDMLDTAGELVGQVADIAGFDHDARLDIQLAAHESMINAIVHGNRSPRSDCTSPAILSASPRSWASSA